MADAPSNPLSSHVHRAPLRLALGVAAAAVALLVVSVGGLALGEPCIKPQPSALTLSEMAMVKRAVDVHARRPGEHLILDGPSASFLLADYLEYPVELGVEDGLLHAELGVPALGVCANVRFVGGVDVTSAGAQVAPESLSIGYLDVSAVARQRRWSVPAALVWRPHAARLLAAMRSLELGESEMMVRIDDPWSLR